jgi:hypothetical protein
MQLRIDGEERHFVAMNEFRARHNLPDDFGVSTFEPKDYTGLGSIDRAGGALNGLRQAILDAIPGQINTAALLPCLDDLTHRFRVGLIAINDQVNLRDEEIEFATAGFGDVCRTLHYAVLRARGDRAHVPDFWQLYGEWLDSTLRISQRVHHYDHNGDTWRVQIVNHAYGRVGLIAHTDEATHYIHDMRLACPAEGFMVTLLQEVTARILAALN